jgi:hypothetical protein
LFLSACGQSLQPFKASDAGVPADDLAKGGTHNGDGGGTAGTDLAMASIDMTGFNQAGSPVVTIMTPTAGTEVQGDTLTVTASITSPTSTPIDAQTVNITITPPGGSVINGAMSLTATAHVYSGHLDIRAVPSGNASFTVSASDTTGLKGSASSAYIHDHGPTITFVQPSAPTAHGQITLEAIVDDSLHPITMLSQVTAGIRTLGDITLAAVAGASPFRVTATIDLNSFNPTLDGPQLITIEATNVKGTKGRATRQVTVDNAGPVIAIDAPAAGTFVGGVLQIQATITDLSDVNDASVVAVFGGNLATSVALRRPDSTSHVYSGFFDVRSLGKSYVFPELSVRADDALGNHGQIGEEIIVDNTPPWMTMNGAIQMRVSKPDDQKNAECSRLFAPLGPVTDQVAKEGDVVPQIATLRARIEDHGNYAPGLLQELFSGIDATQVTLFAEPASIGGMASILAVDTDGDGVCDDVNPLLIPTVDVTMPNEALSLQMAPLTGTGTADYRFDSSSSPPNAAPAGCAEVGDAGVTVPPDSLCPQTGMTYVLPGADKVSPIWSIAPVTGAECGGFQLDTLNRLPEGPTCVIARAVDKAGNQNVSYPLHICIDRGGGLCAGFMPNASDCTGVWNKVTQMIDPGFCNPPTPNTTGFPLSGEVRDLTSIR